MSERYPKRWSKQTVSPGRLHVHLERALREVLTNPGGRLADSGVPNSTVKHYLEQVTLFYSNDRDSQLDALVASLRDAVFNFENEEEVDDG